MKKRRFIIAFALAAVGQFSVAGAQEAPDKPDTTPPIEEEQVQPEQAAETPKRSVEDRVVFLLSGYEYFPTRADLDAVAPAKEIAALLRGFAQDDSRRPTLRIRAVDALGHYDDEKTVALLGRLATTEPDDELPRRKLRTAGLLRHHAITALAKARGEAATAELAGLLDAEDLQIQLTAIHAIGKHCGAAGRAELAKLKKRTDRSIIKRELAKWVD